MFHLDLNQNHVIFKESQHNALHVKKSYQYQLIKSDYLLNGTQFIEAKSKKQKQIRTNLNAFLFFALEVCDKEQFSISSLVFQCWTFF